MEQIQFDTGVREFNLNGRGVLRFHPGDPNVYARFFEAMDKIQSLEEKITEESEKLKETSTGRDAVRLLEETDREVKKILNWTFGEENDFDRILGGVNLLAIAGNGQQIITNLLEALQPILLEGAEKCAKDQVQAAVSAAETRRKENE